MKISTQTHKFSVLYGDEKAIELLAKAGFEAIDFSMFSHGSTILTKSDEEVAEYFAKLRGKVDECGITVNQTHAPFPSANDDPEYNAKMSQVIHKAIIASGVLGAKMVIIHPFIMRENRYGSLSAENKAANVEMYSKLIPDLYKYDVKIAVENMFNWDPEKKCSCPTVCSSSVEMADYVDTMNALCKDGDRFVACLDVGHTAISGEAPIADMVKVLGSRLKSLHVHDNNGTQDLHTAPGFGGKIDFAAFCGALRDIGYDGEFTFEADSFYKCFDDSLAFDAACMLYKIGRNLCDRYGL